MSPTYIVEHAEAARIALDLGEAKKQRPLIRYAGSAAETSIGSKPIGSELSAGFYSWRRGYQNLVRGLRSMNQSPRGLKPIPEPSVNQAENRGRFQFLHSEHKEQPILQPLAGEITLRAIEGRG